MKEIDIKFTIIKYLNFLLIILHLLSCIFVFNFYKFSIFDINRNLELAENNLINVDLDYIDIDFKYFKKIKEIENNLILNQIHNISLLQNSKKFVNHKNKNYFEFYINYKNSRFNDLIILFSISIFGISLITTLGLYVINKSSKKIKRACKLL